MTITLRIPQPRALALVAAILAVLVTGTTVALGVTLNRNGGPVTAVRTATANGYVMTKGTTFTTVPGMQTTVSVSAGEHALLVITFSAVSLCAEPDGIAYCEIRVLVDGVGASPGTVIFDSAEDGEGYAWETNSMQFVHRVNASGPHTVTVQWRSDAPTATGTFAMYERTLTVLRSRIG